MKIVQIGGVSNKILLDTAFSNVGQNMLDQNYIYIYLESMHFSPGQYRVSVTFTHDVAEISGFPAILLATLPRMP
ncbi:MAG: hypothetical protein J0H91_05500 [Rhodospirillales bacterium]|nr:hypothetical protein [Rhodospirillales bacterium]